MTDKFITNPRARPVAVKEAKQSKMQRDQPVPLAWSAALRASHEIIIETTIAYVASVFASLPTH